MRPLCTRRFRQPSSRTYELASRTFGQVDNLLCDWFRLPIVGNNCSTGQYNCCRGRFDISTGRFVFCSGGTSFERAVHLLNPVVQVMYQTVQELFWLIQLLNRKYKRCFVRFKSRTNLFRLSTRYSESLPSALKFWAYSQSFCN